MTAEVSRSRRPARATPAALRILMLSHIPLVRELGEGRVCVELSDEFRKLGHTVETFDRTDAFPGERPARWHRLRPLRFAGRARDYVRRHGARFDVIDALQGVGPLPKGTLGFDGLVVSRSAGLYTFYLRDLERQRSAWPERLPGTRAGQLLARWAQRRAAAACERSMLTADLVNVPNEDERSYLSEQLGIGDRCVVNPLGLTGKHAAALAARPPCRRAAGAQGGGLHRRLEPAQGGRRLGRHRETDPRAGAGHAVSLPGDRHRQGGRARRPGPAVRRRDHRGATLPGLGPALAARTGRRRRPAQLHRGLGSRSPGAAGGGHTDRRLRRVRTALDAGSARPATSSASAG